MFVYWCFFLTISFFAISPIKIEKKLQKILEYFFLFILIIFVGFRKEVGGDWDNYLHFPFANGSFGGGMTELEMIASLHANIYGLSFPLA